MNASKELTSIYCAASVANMSATEFRLYVVLLRQIEEGKLRLPAVVSSRALIDMQGTGSHSSALRGLMALNDKGYVTVEDISASSRPIYHLQQIKYLEGK